MTDDLSRLLLNASKYPTIDVVWAVSQIEARRRMQTKLPSWCAEKQLRFPVRLSLEQCSSERTALYKSELCSGNTLADLTGGFGVDCFYMGQTFRKVFYVEHNAELCALARHNFSVLDFTMAEIFETDAEAFLNMVDFVDMVYIDPARRDVFGRKMVALTDCMPDVTSMQTLLRHKSQRVLLKLSPMIDIASVLRQFPETNEVHIVAVDGECKELLFLIKWGERQEVRFVAVDLQKQSRRHSFTFLPAEEQNALCEYAEEIGRFLYEPNAAVLKSGAFRLVAQRFGLKKLHPNTHLYTSDMLKDGFPGRIFEVATYGNFSKKSLNRMLEGVKQANLSVRNFPETVDSLRKRLKLKEGGPDYLFACTILNNEKVLIKCKRCTLQA